MASFSSFLATKKFPSPKTFRSLLRGPFTAFRVVVYGMLLAACATVFVILIMLNNRTLVTVPASGGHLTEGVIGAPHFINPILSTTETDKRLSALVYSTASDITQDYTVSPDGTIYTITLLPSLRFSDKKALTSDDVAFTVQKLQDNTISSQSGYWENISVDTPDANTVVFTLPAADTSFLNHLNFGILPKHIWENISDQSFESVKQNLYPVGSGAFKVSDISYQDGIPAIVTLDRNAYAVGGDALLHSLTIATYANQSSLLDALNAGDVVFSYDIPPATLANNGLDADLSVEHVATAKTVGLYHSSSDTALSSGTTVMLLNQIIDKNAIIAIVQNGYGTPVGTPSTSLANAPAKSISLKGFSLAVENDPDSLLAAKTLAQQLQQRGITVAVKAYDPGTFQNNINAGSFTIFLARSGDVDIPGQYSLVLPLYTQSVPYIFNVRTHTTVPNTIESSDTEYLNVKNWYTNTNKLWRWFIKTG